MFTKREVEGKIKLYCCCSDSSFKKFEKELWNIHEKELMYLLCIKQCYCIVWSAEKYRR